MKWAKAGTGSNYCSANSIASDVFGNVYITGFYGSPSITFGSFILPNSGPTDLFLVKYDSLGNVLWAKGVGGTFSDEGKSVTTDLSGSVYVTGNFTSPSITFGTTTLTNPGVFVTKCDSAGNFLWAKGAGSGFSGEATGISSNSSGIYATGYFTSDNATFGITTLANSGSVGSGTEDIYVTKYDAAGTLLSTVKYGGTDNDRPYSISADANSVYITGSFSSPSVSFGASSITNNGFSDVFLAKLSLAGSPLWAKSAGGASYDDSYSVSCNTTGVYIVGGFESANITFGSVVLSPLAAGYTPLFLVKYDSLGNAICATAIESGGEGKSSIISDNSGVAYVCGAHNKNPLVVGIDSLANVGYENVFIAKFLCSLGNSIEEVPKTEFFSIYPNPITDETVVYFNEPQKNSRVQIFDCLGKCLFNSSFSGQTFRFGNEWLKRGIYFLKVETENGIEIKKLVKE